MDANLEQALTPKNPLELRASKMAACLSVAMAIFKLGFGSATGSLSLIASGVDSIFDAITSGAGFFLLRMSLEPADQEHPYGHSRIETMASLGQGTLLLFIAAGLSYSASHRFDHSHEPQDFLAILLVPGICSLITFALWVYLGRVARETKSSVIAGDRLHYFTDLAGNVLLLVGFIAARIWHLDNVDAILTLILCLFIFYSGLHIIVDAVKDLVDYNDPGSEDDVKKIVEGFYPEALGTARLRSRKAGRRTAMDLELVSCRQLKFEQVHNISHDVLEKIHTDMPKLDVIIHSEPCSKEQCATESACLFQKSKIRN